MEGYSFKSDKFGITQCKIFGIILCLSVIGIFFVGKKNVLDAKVMDVSTLILMNLQEKGDYKYFLYVLRNRGCIIPILFLMSTTYLGKYAGYAATCWYGFSLGIVMGIAIIQYGMLGIGFLFVGAFPQYLFYIPAFCTALKLTKGQRTRNKKFYCQAIVLEIVVITGCWLESTINLMVLEKFLHYF